MKLSPSDTLPFGVAFIASHLETANAVAAFVLTCLGIVITARKLWLSFRNPRSERDDTNQGKFPFA